MPAHESHAPRVTQLGPLGSLFPGPIIAAQRRGKLFEVSYPGAYLRIIFSASGRFLFSLSVYFSFPCFMLLLSELWPLIDDHKPLVRSPLPHLAELGDLIHTFYSLVTLVARPVGDLPA